MTNFNESTRESRTGFATFAATVNALRQLNFRTHGLCVRTHSVDAVAGTFVLEYGTDTNRSETTGYIYKCRLGYYCVAVSQDIREAPVTWNGSRESWIWQAPVVWSGPRASWDSTTDAETLADFATFVRDALMGI